MTIFKREMRRDCVSVAVWSLSVALMLLMCLVLYPSMSKEMDSITGAFANMGAFTKAFGLDTLNFGELMGYYGVECGNVIGMGGSIFAALMGIAALAREESGRTAEFLLSHPVSRRRVYLEKLAACAAKILIFNAVNVLIAICAFPLAGGEVNWAQFWLIHISQTAMHMEIMCLTFGLSAAISRGGIGAGIGIAMLMYCLGIFSNLSEKAAFLMYITPFAYADAAKIMAETKLNAVYMALGALYAAILLITGYVIYLRRDMRV